MYMKNACAVRLILIEYDFTVFDQYQQIKLIAQLVLFKELLTIIYVIGM